MSFRQFREASCPPQNFFLHFLKYLYYRCTFQAPTLTFATKVQLKGEQRVFLTEALLKESRENLESPLHLPPSLLDTVEWLRVSAVCRAWAPDPRKLDMPVTLVYNVVSLSYGILSFVPLWFEMHVTYMHDTWSGRLVYNPPGSELDTDDAEH